MIYKSLLSVLFCGVFAVSALADLKDDVRQLAREKSKLSRQTSSLFREQKLNEDESYKELEKNAYEASKAFTKARKEHPALKEAYEVSDAAQSRMVKASIAGDKEAKKIAMADYTKARRDLEQAAKKIPELGELQKKAREESELVQLKKKELLATTPAGKELFGKILALEEKIAELRKKL